MHKRLKLREAQNKLRDKVTWLADDVANATRELVEREEEIIYRLSRAAASLTRWEDVSKSSRTARLTNAMRRGWRSVA